MRIERVINHLYDDAVLLRLWWRVLFRIGVHPLQTVVTDPVGPVVLGVRAG